MLKQKTMEVGHSEQDKFLRRQYKVAIKAVKAGSKLDHFWQPIVVQGSILVAYTGPH